MQSIRQTAAKGLTSSAPSFMRPTQSSLQRGLTSSRQSINIMSKVSTKTAALIQSTIDHANKNLLNGEDVLTRLAITTAPRTHRNQDRTTTITRTQDRTTTTTRTRTPDRTTTDRIQDRTTRNREKTARIQAAIRTEDLPRRPTINALSRITERTARTVIDTIENTNKGLYVDDILPCLFISGRSRMPYQERTRTKDAIRTKDTGTKAVHFKEHVKVIYPSRSLKPLAKPATAPRSILKNRQPPAPPPAPKEEPFVTRSFRRRVPTTPRQPGLSSPAARSDDAVRFRVRSLSPGTSPTTIASSDSTFDPWSIPDPWASAYNVLAHRKLTEKPTTTGRIIVPRRRPSQSSTRS